MHRTEKRTYRAAIAGLGNIAWRFGGNAESEYSLTHASAYIRNSGTFLVGGCSPDEGDRAEFGCAFNIPAVRTPEEMIDTLNPDIVSICSPSAFHFEQAAYCIDRNIPMIWLEKPPASSAEELDLLIEKVKNAGGRSNVLVNYQRRYDGNYRKLKEVYLRKTLGECRLIQITYSMGLELNGSHILDILFFIVGDGARYEIEWVSSPDVSENPSFTLVFEYGVQVIVSGVDLPYHCIDISLVCDGGRVSILHGGMTPVVEKRIEHELFPGFYRLGKDGDDYHVFSEKTGTMKKVLEDLIYSFERGTETESSLLSARNTQTLIDAVRERQGKIRS